MYFCVHWNHYDRQMNAIRSYSVDDGGDNMMMTIYNTLFTPLHFVPSEALSAQHTVHAG